MDRSVHWILRLITLLRWNRTMAPAPHGRERASIAKIGTQKTGGVNVNAGRNTVTNDAIGGRGCVGLRFQEQTGIRVWTVDPDLRLCFAPRIAGVSIGIEHVDISADSDLGRGKIDFQGCVVRTGVAAAAAHGQDRIAHGRRIPCQVSEQIHRVAPTVADVALPHRQPQIRPAPATGHYHVRVVGRLDQRKRRDPRRKGPQLRKARGLGQRWWREASGPRRLCEAGGNECAIRLPGVRRAEHGFLNVRERPGRRL